MCLPPQVASAAAFAVLFAVATSACCYADTPPASLPSGTTVPETVTAGAIATDLHDGMSAAQQQAVIERVLGDLESDRFFRRSVVSPFVFELKSIEPLSDGGQRQRLGVWFIVHGTLDQLADKRLLQRLSAAESASEASADQPQAGLPQQARSLTEPELAARGFENGPQADGSERGYGILAINLLDKAFVSGISVSESRRSDDALEIRLQLAPQTLGDADFPAQWQSVAKTPTGDFTLGPGQAYHDFHAVIRVSRLVEHDDTLLVEAHVEYAEPHGWFEGRNLLRSKLPPVLQDAVRKFRRQLAQ